MCIPSGSGVETIGGVHFRSCSSELLIGFFCQRQTQVRPLLMIAGLITRRGSGDKKTPHQSHAHPHQPVVISRINVDKDEETALAIAEGF